MMDDVIVDPKLIIEKRKIPEKYFASLSYLSGLLHILSRMAGYMPVRKERESQKKGGEEA